MALSPRLEVRQSQSLTLTPQLMQSIRLLQLSHLELDVFVEAELLRNPLLEREDGSEAVEAPEPPVEVTAYDDAVEAGERIQDAEGIAGIFRYRGRERLSGAAGRGLAGRATGRVRRAAAARAARRRTSISSSQRGRRWPTI